MSDDRERDTNLLEIQDNNKRIFKDWQRSKLGKRSKRVPELNDEEMPLPDDGAGMEAPFGAGGY